MSLEEKKKKRQKMIKEIFDITNENHISSGKFSISSIGTCLRKKYLEIKGLYKEVYDVKTMRAFSLGLLFHQQAVKEIMEKGEQIGLHVVSSEVNIPENKYFSGRADLIMSIASTGELIICDIKSSSDFVLNKAKEGECSENYINQVQLYLHFFGLKKGYVLFFGKHRGGIEEIPVVYNKEKAEKLIQDIEDFFTNYIENDVIPNKCINPQFPCNCCYPNGEKSPEPKDLNTKDTL